MNMNLNLDIFKQRFRSGLIYSLIEGLEAGYTLTFESDIPLLDCKLELENLNMPDIKLSEGRGKSGIWQLSVKKEAASHKAGGCCGICGTLPEKSSNVG
jgi:uncharacterized protein (DUF2249 family)